MSQSDTIDFVGAAFDPEGRDRPQVWSNGGGVQSAAIAALIVRGDIPKPDLAVIADTGREVSTTWSYLESTIRPALESVGVEMHIAGHDLSTVDLWSGKDGNTLLMPMHTDQSGKPGRLPSFCSSEWKKRVFERFCKANGIREADVWIGFSTDEMQRCKVDRMEQWQHVYPLIAKRKRRGDCIALVESMGWPTPPKSMCWQCPHKRDEQWRETPRADFAKAVELERELRKRNKHVFFHKSCKPLSEVDFSKDQGDLFDADDCGSGMCFT